MIGGKMKSLILFGLLFIHQVIAKKEYDMSLVSEGVEDDESTLVLAHVIFRHGDRTPDDSTIYPEDPYKNETYFPYGKGQLVLEGKRRAYSLGQSLRRRFAGFLGPIYHPDIIEGTSSAYPRTQMTLQSVMSALFPPSEDFKIREDINWQPIPYKFSDYNEDKLIATFRSCEKIFEIADELEQTHRYHVILKRFYKLRDYLSKYSGWRVNNTRFTFFIQNTLKTEEEWGFPLPEWSNSVWPEPMASAASMFWKVMVSTVELRRLQIGNLLKKIVDDSVKKIEGTLTPKDRKLFLYSGHDFTLVPMLAAFENYDGSHLEYTSHIIFELHKIHDIYGFKIYLQDYKQKMPRLLNVKFCGTFCPIEGFIELLMDHFPDKNWCS